jgi:hypothetical protein
MVKINSKLLFNFVKTYSFVKFSNNLEPVFTKIYNNEVEKATQCNKYVKVEILDDSFIRSKGVTLSIIYSSFIDCIIPSH